MRILFTFVGGAGHFEPLLPIARAASAAGHEVSFVCRPSMTIHVEATGFAVVGIDPDVPDPPAIVPLAAIDEHHEERVLRYGFAGTTARQRATGVIEVCAALQPDIVVSDEADYGATIAAEVLGLHT